MNLWVAGLIIAGVVAVAVTLMALLRRRAPLGGFFSDTARSAGVFGVLGMSFAVLLAFVIFVAFESYADARQKADQEAVAVTTLFRDAGFFAPPARDELRLDLTCYARAVIYDEWPAMRHQRDSPLVRGWISTIEGTVERLDIHGAVQEAGLANWGQTQVLRREGRRGRLSEASPFVPAPLWLVLILGAALVVGFTCLHADPGEGLAVQAMMTAAITAVVVAGLLTVRFLDHPYENRSGSIKPAEMTRTLELMEQAEPNLLRNSAPCDAHGRPTRE
jgi:hypothetical protein